jgi:hypothetical protein
LDRTNVT